MKLGKIFFIKLFISLISLPLFLKALINFTFKIDEQKCAMTYMWEFPNFERHFPSVNESAENKWYGLYHYSEGTHYLRKKGVPVLFVPGNSGSYKQVRSFASVSLRMSLKNGDSDQLFDYFTVDLNEELSALSGAIIRRQVRYVDACLTYLVTLYGDNTPIVIMGHSMGAVVARAVMTQSHHRVAMIVALASPLEVPVVGLDPDLVRLYREVNQLWVETASVHEIVVISITGGNRDQLVWDGYGRVTTARHSLWLPAWSVANVGVSTDHLSVCWCRQLVIALTKAMHRSLTTTHTTTAHNLLASMRHHLVPSSPPPLNVTSHIDIDYNYLHLVLRPVTIFLPASHRHSHTISMPALSSVTRPLRIQVIPTHGCPSDDSDIKFTLHSTHNRQTHTHKYTTQHHSVLLSLVETSSVPAVVTLELSSSCGYSVTVSASIIDWLAHLMRVHIGLVPSLVAALTITQYTYTHSITSLPLVLATVWLSFLSAWSTDLSWLHTYTSIDIADLALLLALSLPLAALLSAIATVLTTISALWSVSATLLLLCSALLLPLAIFLAATCPSLAFIVLLLVHLLSVGISQNLQSTNHNDDLLTPHTVTLIIGLVFLLDLAPLLAQLHSLIQHDHWRAIVTRGLAGLVDLEALSIGDPRVLMTAAVVGSRLMRARTQRRARSALMTTNVCLSSALLGSLCVVVGAVDSSRCGSCLIGGLVLLAVCDLLRPGTADTATPK